MELQKNCEYEGEVVALGTGGEGIINMQGTTAFVPYCLIGERVKFKALKVKDNVVFGKLLKVLTPSPDRVTPVCPVFGQCGGCSLQHLNYEGQREFKRSAVKNALKKIGGIDFEVSPCVESPSVYNYRNKLALPVGRGEKGKLAVGFYAERSHRIVPIESCAIQAVWAADLIKAVKKFAEYASINGYDEVTGKGELRHIVAREIQGKFIFALVCTKIVDVKPLVRQLDKYFNEHTLLININKSDTNAIFGKEWHICRGEGFFEAEDAGIKFKAGANTFLQVNDGVRAKLYQEVVKAAGGADVILDLYSGGGMLTAMLAKNCGKAYGVEIVEEASRCADELAAMNGLSGKMVNICGSVEQNIDKIFKKTEGKSRVIVCDPPRKGMERSVVKKIAQSGAEKVVLVSCNPSTLARDLGLIVGTLKEEDGKIVKAENNFTPQYAVNNDISDKNRSPLGNYTIQSITPFDMFPQTPHVETLVILSHKKPDGHISVKVEFGEEEGQVSLKEVAKRAEERKPKEKVTYKMIQAYIEQTYGFKVHTAYIAEVKRDLGLPMYDAPNAVEELKCPRAHPTPKMVEAIKETLKHFEII